MMKECKELSANEGGSRDGRRHPACEEPETLGTCAQRRETPRLSRCHLICKVSVACVPLRHPNETMWVLKLTEHFVGEKGETGKAGRGKAGMRGKPSERPPVRSPAGL